MATSHTTSVYIVTMHRWGDDESHNYVQGVFSYKAKAELAGDAEKAYRGSKYEYKITEATLDNTDTESLAYFLSCQYNKEQHND